MFEITTFFLSIEGTNSILPKRIRKSQAFWIRNSAEKIQESKLVINLGWISCHNKRESRKALKPYHNNNVGIMKTNKPKTTVTKGRFRELSIEIFRYREPLRAMQKLFQEKPKHFFSAIIKDFKITSQPITPVI